MEAFAVNRCGWSRSISGCRVSWLLQLSENNVRQLCQKRLPCWLEIQTRTKTIDLPTQTRLVVGIGACTNLHNGAVTSPRIPKCFSLFANTRLAQWVGTEEKISIGVLGCWINSVANSFSLFPTPSLSFSLRPEVTLCGLQDVKIQNLSHATPPPPRSLSPSLSLSVPLSLLPAYLFLLSTNQIYAWRNLHETSFPSIYPTRD